MWVTYNEGETVDDDEARLSQHLVVRLHQSLKVGVPTGRKVLAKALCMTRLVPDNESAPIIIYISACNRRLQDKEHTKQVA